MRARSRNRDVLPPALRAQHFAARAAWHRWHPISRPAPAHSAQALAGRPSDPLYEIRKQLRLAYIARIAPRPEEVRNFWFGMARHEAGHCGALALVESIIESDPERGEQSKVWFDEATARRKLLPAQVELLDRLVALTRRT